MAGYAQPSKIDDESADGSFQSTNFSKYVVTEHECRVVYQQTFSNEIKETATKHTDRDSFCAIPAEKNEVLPPFFGRKKSRMKFKLKKKSQPKFSEVGPQKHENKNLLEKSCTFA